MIRNSSTMAKFYRPANLRFLQALPSLKNNRLEIVDSLKKCFAESGAGSKEMENRGMLSGVTYSLGFFWSMLGFGSKANSNKEWMRDKTVSSYIEQAEVAIKVRTFLIVYNNIWKNCVQCVLLYYYRKIN